MIRINHLLIVHRGMDGGDGARINAECVIQYLDDGHNAVGGTRTVRDDFMLSSERLMIHAIDDGVVEIASTRMGK
ncbi:Uncharacterised protein [Vibrio cholerae]|nr:Uncharacterised protein [Vibrio cholerae]CSI73705.1 Uncharacterised protein [Vibrio cholerae]